MELIEKFKCYVFMKIVEKLLIVEPDKSTDYIKFYGIKKYFKIKKIKNFVNILNILYGEIPENLKRIPLRYFTKRILLYDYDIGFYEFLDGSDYHSSDRSLNEYFLENFNKSIYKYNFRFGIYKEKIVKLNLFEQAVFKIVQDYDFYKKNLTIIPTSQRELINFIMFNKEYNRYSLDITDYNIILDPLKKVNQKKYLICYRDRLPTHYEDYYLIDILVNTKKGGYNLQKCVVTNYQNLYYNYENFDKLRVIVIKKSNKEINLFYKKMRVPENFEKVGLVYEEYEFDGVNRFNKKKWSKTYYRDSIILIKSVDIKYRLLSVIRSNPFIDIICSNENVNANKKLMFFNNKLNQLF
jgi:hypothetical protein